MSGSGQSRGGRPETAGEDLELPLGDPGYPLPLAEIPGAPESLHVRGRLPTDTAAVAVVGARECTRYGRRVAARLAADLARAGVVVVSGLARGIDATAHRATIGAGGCTVAVLPGGLDRPYPPRHAALAREIVRSGGALVTERPAGSEVAPWSFPRRNRIIAGLARVVVVVEAAERSGARITAGLAIDQGREVLVVPGPVTSPVSRGCHALLSEGAHPCTDVADVLALLPAADLARLRASTPGRRQGRLRPEERRVLSALETASSATVDQLHVRTRMTLADLLEVVTRLELAGWIEVQGTRVDLIRSRPTDTQ